MRVVRRATFIGVFAAWAMGLGSSAIAQLPGGTWQYHWGDDFSGNSLDTTKWSYNYPWGTTHNHDAVMSPNQVRVADGRLTIEATRTGSGANFVSGAVTTGYDRFTFNGGYVEAGIRLPDTPGSWPAFWGLFSGWPPENDIMEYPIDTAAGSGYSQDQYHTAFHYSTGSGNAAGAGQVNPAGVGDLGGTFHTFGMEWREDDWVGYYFNGQLVQQFGNDAAIAQMERMYLILNYAVGGWPGTPNTSEWAVGHSDQMQVDFVRVWKQAGGKASNWAPTGSATNVSWDSGGNWTNGVPNLGGVTSSFGTVTSAEQNIDWSGRRTLTVVNVDGDTRYRFGTSGDRMVLGYGNNGNLHPAINVAATSSVAHEVQADLEFAGGLNITNDSAHPLLLKGGVMGAGALEINGPGIVSFDGANSYTGDTILDSGPQGPAIARARGVRPFGYGGTVDIGPGGNSTTARLELEGGTAVPNSITFRGRTNLSPAIVNNSGNNTLSGTLNLNYGGTTYQIRSDAGLMTLSGDADGANGVSLNTPSGMGVRSVTLDGAGDGLIRGAIQNASGTTLGIEKTGAGTWTLRGSNSYAGPTVVSHGALIVDGTTGAGDTSVASGATLAGNGVVRGSLLTSAGSRVRVGGAGLPFVFDHTVIDDFEGYNLGDVRNVADPPWTAHQDTSLVDIELDGGNQVLTYGWTGGFRGASRELSADVFTSEGATATYFFRFSSKTATPDHNVGLADGTSIDGVEFGDYEAQLRLRQGTSASTFALDARSGGGFTSTLLADLPLNVWHNTWMVVNNATDTYDIYVTTGDMDATTANKLNPAPLAFRNGTAQPLDHVLAFAGAANVDNGVRIDDLIYYQGINLSNPLAAVPTIAGETLTVDGDLMLAADATLEIDIDSAAHDVLVVGGEASLFGTLAVTLMPGFTPAPGQTFTVLTADSLSINLTLGGPHGQLFNLEASTDDSLVLTALSPLGGDFNNDGFVDSADYTVWRDQLGALYTQDDYDVWKNNFGMSLNMAASAFSDLSVPEPATLTGCMLILAMGLFCRRKWPTVDGKTDSTAARQ